jgi:hypothetical protein
MAQLKQASRAYARRLTLAMVGYGVLLAAAILAINAYPTAWWRYPLWVLPVVPLVYVAWAVVRLMGASDEMHRQIQLEALAFAFGAGSLVTFTYGMLQIAGLPELSWVFVWPVYAVSWLVGGFLAQRRYV